MGKFPNFDNYECLFRGVHPEEKLTFTIKDGLDENRFYIGEFSLQEENNKAKD